MRITKPEIARYAAAILFGGIAYVIAHILNEYIWIWFGAYETFFWDYFFTAIFFELPFYFMAAITASVVFNFVLRPVDDNETRCRKCGYILKGISEPKCSECGEQI